MSFLLLALLGLMFIGVKIYSPCKEDKFNAFDKDQTTSIKGIFAIIIFFSHVRGYLAIGQEWYNFGYNSIINQIGQLMVVMFFFYSGYGIIKSANSKPNYFKKFPINRILKTWLHLSLCVLLYLIVQLILGSDYSISTILLAFTGWTSLGNSNWFMFIILSLYIILYLMSIFTKDNKILSIAMFIVTLGFIIGISFVKESWWYDTMLAFPAGMAFATWQNKYEQIFISTNKRYYLSLFACLAVFTSLYVACWFFNPFLITYNLLSCGFATVIVMITYKIQIINKPLLFLGKHSFSIYMLQRIPMILFAHTSLVNYSILFTMVCFVITLCLSVSFDFATKKMDIVLFKG